MKETKTMKRLQSLVCSIAVIGLTTAPLLAQSGAPRTNRTAAAGELDSKTHGANIRVSQLTGMNIQNAEGKSVGEINDLVLNTNTGKIQYAAVTYGGFLGIGNKMFAVPFEAFKFKPDPDDADETVLVLNVTQQQLEGSVGFDENSCPDFADEEFTSGLYKRYGVQRNMKNRGARVDVNVDRNGVDVDVNGKRDRK